MSQLCTLKGLLKVRCVAMLSYVRNCMFKPLQAHILYSLVLHFLHIDLCPMFRQLNVSMYANGPPQIKCILHALTLNDIILHSLLHTGKSAQRKWTVRTSEPEAECSFADYINGHF